MIKQEVKYIRVSEFFRNATPTTIAEDVRKEIQREYDRPITTSEAYRRAGIDAEAWSKLAHQVFGGEVDL